MPKSPIKLGQAHGGDLSDSVPMSMPAPEMYHPSTCLEWGEDYDLPDEGTITFRYRVTRSVEEKRPSGDKYREEIDLLELLDVVPAKSSEKEDDYGGPALDKLRDEVTGKK